MKTHTSNRAIYINWKALYSKQTYVQTVADIQSLKATQTQRAGKKE